MKNVIALGLLACAAFNASANVLEYDEIQGSIEVGCQGAVWDVVAANKLKLELTTAESDALGDKAGEIMRVAVYGPVDTVITQCVIDFYKEDVDKSTTQINSAETKAWLEAKGQQFLPRLQEVESTLNGVMIPMGIQDAKREKALKERRQKIVMEAILQEQLQKVVNAQNALNKQ